MPKKSAGGPRGAVLNVRVPARLKFGLELVSRTYNESLSDVLIRALNDSLTSENGGVMVHVDGSEHPVDLLKQVWDEDELLRTAKLAFAYPALLLKSERDAWNVVQADDKYWAKAAGAKKAKAGTAPKRQLEALQLEVLRGDWSQLVQNASV